MRETSLHLTFRLFLVVALIVGVAACDEDEEPTTKPGFGTADASNLLIDEEFVPDGMTLDEGSSGPVTVYQLTDDSERVESLTQAGAEAGFLNHFEREEPNSTQHGLGAEVLLSWALVLPDDAGAERALDVLRTVPEQMRENVDVRDARGLGGGAIVQRSRIDGSQSILFAWRVRNAVVALEGRAAEGELNAERLQAMARRLALKNDRAKPTGDDLPLLAAVELGDTLLDEDFQGARDWQLEDESADGAPLSRYAAGGLLVAIDGPGARWDDTSAIRDADLDGIDDVVIDVIAEHVEGRTARWGVMCRVIEEAGFYLFVVGTDGYVGAFTTFGPSEPLETIAEVHKHPVVREAVRAGPHSLRLSCAGEPIATLALQMNGVSVLEAYDDDPRTLGAAGLWIESLEGPAAALYDDLVVSEAAVD